MKTVVFFVLLCSVCLLGGQEFKLTENGEPACSIVLKENAGPVEKHAAAELSEFLGKISGGKAPSIGQAPEAGLYPVYLEFTDDPAVGPEGFRIQADKNALRIAGREPIGILYGAYEVLKKDAGIRWLVPGADGEYFTLKPTITVPEGVRIKNPDFRVRDISEVVMNWGSPVWDTRDWGVRNNMRFIMDDNKVAKNNQQQRLSARGVVGQIGGHCFTTMMTGWTLDYGGKTYKEHVDQLFNDHPEYFPLINGQRRVTYYMGNEPQPCTSNPDVIKRTAAHILRWQERALQRGHNKPTLDFGSNDSTKWCECDNCRAIDPPGEKSRGNFSTRYWTFANAVFEEIRKTDPDFKFGGWTYANYADVPEGVKPDAKIDKIMISNHYRCWKHELNDPDCVSNRRFFTYNSVWNETGCPLFTYEELISAGRLFLPTEKEWARSLKFYNQNLKNVVGMVTEVVCPDGELGGAYDNFFNRHNWYMMWQTMYMGMYFHWDVNADVDEIYEEINSLYYGKGWAGGMRDFRNYLHDLYMNAGGCWGFAHSTPVGKFLDVPGAKEKLYKSLDSAEKAAATDPDPRALAHVKMVREYFEMTWVKAHADYIANYREIKAYPLMGEIVIDGILDEKDWRNADGVTRFTKAYDSGLAEHQTSVKVSYDKEYFYIGVECLEPFPEKMKSTIKEFDGRIWADNDVEIFLNDPILGGTYFQICVNALGTFCDGRVVPGTAFDKSYDSGAEVKTSIGDDRWFIEMRVPAKNLTGSMLDAGNVLKMNVFRCRVVEGEKNEHSTWSIGTPHNVDTFHAVSLASPRALNPNSKELDTRLWANATFNEISKKTGIQKGWTSNGDKMPASWGLSDGYKGEFLYQLHPGSTDNYYVTLSGGYLANRCSIKSDKIACSIRLRGKGALRFLAIRYTPQWHNKASTLVKVLDVDSDEWETFSFEFERPGDKDEIHLMALWPTAKSKIDIDDMYLAPK